MDPITKAAAEAAKARRKKGIKPKPPNCLTPPTPMTQEESDREIAKLDADLKSRSPERHRQQMKDIERLSKPAWDWLVDQVMERHGFTREYAIYQLALWGG